MKIVLPGFEFIGFTDGLSLVKELEEIARTCYKSEGRINEDSYRPFLERILKSGHESVIEHEKVTVKIICDRGVSHEIVRHRIASYSQESTRYCNYTNEKFGNELTFIRPCFWIEDEKKYRIWHASMKKAEEDYMELIKDGASPQEARSILPNSLKTEIVVTMNMREWRHFFRLRTSPAAHPQMREITIPLLSEFKARIPVLFDDL